MPKIRFDFNNMMDFNVGVHGVKPSELKTFSARAGKAFNHLTSVLKNRQSRIALSLEWSKLPLQDKKVVASIQRLGKGIADKYENVISLGIGGSYLGIKAAQDALLPPYYNDFPGVRKGSPRIFFEGNNLDPVTLSSLLSNLNPRKTFVVVISKSGETTETKAALELVEAWLKRGAGAKFARQIIAVTDPKAGTLRKKVSEASAKDPLAYRSLPLLEGVGGRFSELNMGLLHLAITGVKIAEVLEGAADMAKSCALADMFKNPALFYASLSVIAYEKKGKQISIIMPFSEQLKSTADWYIQLLAESTGKKYARKIVFEQGAEKWVEDRSRIINTGRTPISARGTNDLHSIQQNNIEGRNDKVVTFIRVEKYKKDLKLPISEDFLSGRTLSGLLKTAQEGTAWALNREMRPNCTISLPELNAYYWGALLFFFEMATAYEGELLGINAFNQPGVESYKNYMFYKLNKPGIKKEIAEEINTNPMKKDPGYFA